MKKLDEKFLIHGPTHGFYLSAKQLSELQGSSTRHVWNLINGIREQIKKGRYSRYAIIDSGGVRVNIYAYYDFDKYRKMLADKNACKAVPDFNPAELAALCPVMQRVIIIDPEGAET